MNEDQKQNRQELVVSEVGSEAKIDIPKHPILSNEERIINIEAQVKDNEEKISQSIKSAEKTKIELDSIRNILGLSSTEHIPHSLSSAKERQEELKLKQQDLENQKEAINNEQKKEEMVTSEQKEMSREKDAEGMITDEQKDLSKEREMVNVKEKDSHPEKKEKEISEETLAQLSEAIQIKKGLEFSVGILKDSQEFKEFEKANNELAKKRKRLEELKKRDNPTNINLNGSISINGPVSLNSNLKFEGSESDKSESTEKNEKIDLQKEAENLFAKTNFEILKLQKQVMEYNPESLKIKAGELEIESKKVEIETDIWSSGDMDHKKFNETLDEINKPEGEVKDINNKELFIKLSDINFELKEYSDKNKEYHKNIEEKQKEIDSEEEKIQGLDFSNQDKVLKILIQYNIENIKIDENNEKKKIEKAESLMTPEQLNSSREREAEFMMNDVQKEQSEERASTYDQQKAA